VPTSHGGASRKVVLSPAVWAFLLFLVALAPRLPGLRLFLTTDEPFFVQEAANVMAAFLRSDFQETYWHFYPGVTISWLSGLGLGAEWVIARLSGASNQLSPTYVHDAVLSSMVAVRIPYALLTACGVAGFYLLARRLFGHWTALLGALFIAFDPFYLAHSRVAHGDAPVTVFMGLSVLAFLVYLQETPRYNTRGVAGVEREGASQERWWLILSAAMGALAALTKAPGQVMALFVIFVAVGDWLLSSWRGQRLDWLLAKRWLVDLILWGGVAVLIFVVLWPAMWVRPVETLLRMLDETFGKVEEGHLVFFMGQPTLNPGPWFYPYVIAFRLTPVTLIGAILSGMLVVIRWAALAMKGDRPPGHYVAAALLWFYVVGLLLVGNLSPKKQDRYLLPLLPMLDLLAAFAYVEISKSANRQIGKSADKRLIIRSTRYATRIVLLLLLLLIHAFPVITAYPYYLAYFNPLMGGLSRAIETTLVGWGEGMEEAAAYLNRRSDADQLYVASVPAQTFLPYFKGTGENFYTNDVALRADYVVLYVSQMQRLAPSPEIVRHFLAMDPEHTVHVLGAPYARIYPGPKLITTEIPPDATLTNVGFGDQLRLAGYQIANQQISKSANQQAPSSQPLIHNLEIVLYWQALVPMRSDYTVSVRVVAPDGTWLAQHDGWPGGGLLPTSQLRQGDYVRDVHTLEVPPGATVDRVQVVVYDAESGEALGAPLDLPLAEGRDE
jgi:4-amino-4-deoxy-L-arabinose transferase-like glycosyltransferase